VINFCKTCDKPIGEEEWSHYREGHIVTALYDQNELLEKITYYSRLVNKAKEEKQEGAERLFGDHLAKFKRWLEKGEK
jgi:hypothetical protein